MEKSASINLYEFQREAIEKLIFFLNHNAAHAAYNACEMGLGKTIQTCFIADFMKMKRVLIISPAIVRLVWEKEIKKICDGEVLVVESGSGINALFGSKYRFVVISYNLASNYPISKYLSELKWDLLVMDEAHYLKNSRAKRTKVVLDKIWPAATHRLALSGTPFTTRVVDGYTLFRRMVPGRWADFEQFATEFSFKRLIKLKHRTVVDYFGIKNAPTLRDIIRKNFYVRYTKEEVLKELPDKVFNRIPLPIEYAVVPKGTTDKEKLKAEAELARRSIEEGRIPHIPDSLAEHRRLQGEAKVKAVVEFAEDLLEQDIPIVIYAWHKNVIAALQKALSDYSPAVITGDTPEQKRRKAVENFQTGATKCFIGNFQAAGIGITLTAASTVILAEQDWSPTVISQAIDRLHRIGQKDIVNIYYFVVEGSIDEAITNTVMSRAKIFKSVLDEEAK